MRLIAALLLLPLLSSAREILVKDPAGLDAAIQSARPGDEIILPEAEWADTVIRFSGQGTAKAPITLRAKVPGKTILTGASALRIGGEHLVVEGLWFKDPQPAAGDTLEFRLDSKHLAHHCRLTQCAITLAPELASRTDEESRWVGLYGSDNQVDHCLLQGKLSKGTTLVVWLGEGNEGRHLLEQNYFGPREKLGKNGGETIRIGDSKTSMQTASCIIRQNLFERCNGEAECISNKSCGNLYQDNTFIEVSGTLTLRHGNGCTVERNRFFGNGAKGSGGIRIIGEDHIVKDNYLENLAGDEVRSGITMMLGIPDSAANGYFQVKRARVENNTLVDCKQPLLIGLEGDKVSNRPVLPPMDSVILNNKVHAPKAEVVEARCVLSGIKWVDNQFYGKVLGIAETTGIAWKEPAIEKVQPPARADFGPAWWK